MVFDQLSPWRWADADGVEHEVSDWDLVEALASGALPPYTLVWRRGWGEWLPACRVAELRAAIGPEHGEEPIEPLLEPELRRPPEPPLEWYERYRARELVGAFGPEPETFAGRTLERRREPLPTLAEPSPAEGSDTLRPPGAVPPPPRGVPAPVLAPRSPRGTQDTLADLGTPLTTPMPSFLRGGASSGAEPGRGALRAPAPPNLAGLTSADATPLSGAPRPGHAPGSTAAPQAAPAAAPHVVAPSPAPLAVPSGPADPTLRRRLPSLPSPEKLRRQYWIGGLLSAAAVAVTVGYGALDHGAPTAPAMSVPSSDGPAAAPPARAECRVARPARRLAAQVTASVPVHANSVERESAIALGFAVEKNTAVGLLVQPSDGRVETRLSRVMNARIRGVVPLSSPSELEFAVDTAEGELSSARTVAAERPFQLGLREQRLMRVFHDGTAEALWPVDADSITEPRVATVLGRGHLVTFRAGDQSGAVLVGWLHLNGARDSALQGVQAEARWRGVPVAAASDARNVVAFAAREHERAAWHLRLGSAPVPQLPATTARFEVPPGGPGGSAIAPSLSPLPDGGFIVQWTEGGTGHYQVRAQVLRSDLTPSGAPLTLSPAGANAGQGTIWVNGKRGVSVFLVSAGAQHELWGVDLECA